MTSTSNLFTETSIGKLALKNRLAVAPMTRLSASAEGLATDDMMRCQLEEPFKGALADPDWPQEVLRIEPLTEFDYALLQPLANIKPSEIRSAPCADWNRTRQRYPARCGHQRPEA